MKYTKASDWNGKDLKGVWEFTLKIDGVRAFWKGDDGWVSRNGKPLYNIPHADDLPRELLGCEGVEVYCSKPGRPSKENYKATIKCVRAKTKDRPIRPNELYSLEPLNYRLNLHGTIDVHRYENPTAEKIKAHLAVAVADGYEGLVLRQGDKWIKVKPSETHDVTFDAIIEGTGKHKGRLGAVVTPMGKVGTGFTDKEREDIWANAKRVRSLAPKGYPKGSIMVIPETIIEVSCMQLTPAGKFRHPRFERIRYDK